MLTVITMSQKTNNRLSVHFHLIVPLINLSHAGQRPACAWFDSVRNIGMRASVHVCVSACPLGYKQLEAWYELYMIV